MLTYKHDTFNGHELLFADWKRVSGLEKKKLNVNGGLLLQPHPSAIETFHIV